MIFKMNTKIFIKWIAWVVCCHKIAAADKIICDKKALSKLKGLAIFLHLQTNLPQAFIQIFACGNVGI